MGDILVSGGTDCTVRVWDLEDLELVTTFIFLGHTSTVQIVEPVLHQATGQFQPPYPMIVTGSRDTTATGMETPSKT